MKITPEKWTINRNSTWWMVCSWINSDLPPFSPRSELQGSPNRSSELDDLFAGHISTSALSPHFGHWPCGNNMFSSCFFVVQYLFYPEGNVFSFRALKKNPSRTSWCSFRPNETSKINWLCIMGYITICKYL